MVTSGNWRASHFDNASPRATVSRKKECGKHSQRSYHRLQIAEFNAPFNGGSQVKAALSIDVQAIRSDEMYRLDDFKTLTGLGSAAMRSARRVA